MANDKNRNNQSDKGRDKGQNDSGKRRYIGEGQSDGDKIRKGAEITPRPEKPKGDSNNKR